MLNLAASAHHIIPYVIVHTVSASVATTVVAAVVFSAIFPVPVTPHPLLVITGVLSFKSFIVTVSIFVNVKFPVPLSVVTILTSCDVCDS
jgi:hypothetical protein